MMAKTLATAVLMGVVAAAWGCTQGETNQAKVGAEKAIDATKAAGDRAVETVTDGWITTKVKAKFADEVLLKGSHVNVDTNNHSVVLRGTVLSNEGKTRASVIVSGTEGVTRVTNQLAVVN